MDTPRSEFYYTPLNTFREQPKVYIELNLSLIDAIKDNCDISYIQNLLLDKNIIKNINKRNNHNETPLMVAVKLKNVTLIQYLLDYGAKITDDIMELVDLTNREGKVIFGILASNIKQKQHCIRCF